MYFSDDEKRQLIDTAMQNPISLKPSLHEQFTQVLPIEAWGLLSVCVLIAALYYREWVFSFFSPIKGSLMRVIGLIIYLGISLVQMAAIIGGLEDWLGFHWVAALTLAFVVTWIPLLGTVLGIGGAMTAWHWEWWQACGLFVFPLILSFMIGTGAKILTKVKKY